MTFCAAIMVTRAVRISMTFENTSSNRSNQSDKIIIDAKTTFPL